MTAVDGSKPPGIKKIEAGLKILRTAEKFNREIEGIEDPNEGLIEVQAALESGEDPVISSAYKSTVETVKSLYGEQEAARFQRLLDEGTANAQKYLGDLERTRGGICG